MTIVETVQRGRPRKGGERYPGGRLKADDPRHVVLAQPHRRDERHRLDQRAETPLGRLNIHGYISDAQYDAAKTYGGIVGRYLAVIEAPWQGISSGGTGFIHPLEAARRKEEYGAAWEAVADAGLLAARCVARMSVYDEPCPDGCFPHLLRGLDALAVHFRLTRKRGSHPTKMVK